MGKEGDHNIAYFEALANKWLQGEISPEQKEELEHWFVENQDKDVTIPAEFALDERQHEKALLEKIYRQMPSGTPHHKQNKHKHLVVSRWVAAAAVLVFIISITWYIKTLPDLQPIPDAMTKVHDIAPGHSGAVLHLSDGSQVVLDNLKDGTVFQQEGVKIIKENGQLKYMGSADKVVYNDIVTDRGRQWKATLPDGTKVWLNASSSLHYPITFEGQAQRMVTLSGEAFFEVAHNARQPFQIKVGKTLIEDIGTSFNVNAYPDETGVVTTLVEGLVEVDKVPLKPGQQAIVTQDGGIKIKEVNTDDFTAWVKGQISLDNVSIRELMRQLSRWYDVDVVYNGKIPDIRLGGIIDRNVYITTIIKALNAYGVNVKVKGKSLVVSP